MEYIDVRSDTVTFPTQEMRKCLLTVAVGDDVYGDDPSANQLEALAAEMLGKEAACLVPTGVFGNLCAVYTHGKPGEQIIISNESHMILYENGSLGRFCRMLTRTIKTDGGIMDPAKVRANIKSDKNSYYTPYTSLLEVEFPTNLGRLYPLQTLAQLYQIAKEKGLNVHMDAARLFNGCAALGVDPREVTKYTDSVMMCLSKGLCAPAGSIVAGSREYIERFRRNRKLFGGGLRQAGFIAGPGIIALKEMTKHVATDNKMAKLFADKISKLEWAQIVCPVEITMVFFKIVNVDQSLKPEELRNYLKANKILMGIPDDLNNSVRIVAHHYFREKEVDILIEKLDTFIRKHLKKSN